MNRLVACVVLALVPGVAGAQVCVSKVGGQTRISNEKPCPNGSALVKSTLYTWSDEERATRAKADAEARARVNAAAARRAMEAAEQQKQEERAEALERVARQNAAQIEQFGRIVTQPMQSGGVRMTTR